MSSKHSENPKQSQDNRQEVSRTLLDLSLRYEKQLYLICGGALGVTLPYIDKIAPNPIPWTRSLIIVSWIGLASALLLVAWALRSSQQTVNLDYEIDLEGVEESLGNRGARLERFEESRRKTLCLSGLTIWAATIGITFLTLFASINYAYTYSQPTVSASKSESLVESRPNVRPASEATNRAGSASENQVTVYFQPFPESSRSINNVSPTQAHP